MACRDGGGWGGRESIQERKIKLKEMGYRSDILILILFLEIEMRNYNLIRLEKKSFSVRLRIRRRKESRSVNKINFNLCLQF